MTAARIHSLARKTEDSIGEVQLGIQNVAANTHGIHSAIQSISRTMSADKPLLAEIQAHTSTIEAGMQGISNSRKSTASSITSVLQTVQQGARTGDRMTSALNQAQAASSATAEQLQNVASTTENAAAGVRAALEQLDARALPRSG
jgi:phage-related protein